MGWVIAVIIIIVLGALTWAAVPVVLAFFGVRYVRRRFLGSSDGERDGTTRIKVGPRPGIPIAPLHHPGCPHQEAMELQKMERRLEEAHGQCAAALDRRMASELARARVEPPLEDAYYQISNEIKAIYAFCERNDLSGTLTKAKGPSSARDIYQEAYERDLAKVRDAIARTEECLRAYERTVATLEVSSVQADIGSDLDASIEMLRELRAELPSYSLEDRV